MSAPDYPPTPAAGKPGDFGPLHELENPAAMNASDASLAGIILPAGDSPASPPNDSSESIQATALEFEQHIEQLTAFKQHLTSQMELLRHEGLKLLEKQKRITQEKARVEAHTAAREAEFQQRQTQLEQQAQQLQAQQSTWEQTTAERQRTLAEQETALSAQAAALTQQQTALAQQQAALENQRQELTQKFAGQQSELEQKLQEAAAQAATFAGRTAALEEQTAQERAALKQLAADLERQRTELENQQFKALEEQEAAQQQLTQAQAQLTQERQNLQQEQAQLQERHTAAQAAINALQTQLAAQELALAGEKQSLEALRTELTRRETTLAQREQGLESSLQTRRDELEKFLAKREHEIAAAGLQLETRRRELERWKNSILEEEQRMLSRQMELSEGLEKLELEKQRLGAPITTADAGATSSALVELNVQRSELAAQQIKLNTQEATLSEQLAELRNAREQFSQEREAWTLQQAQQAENFASKVRELAKTEESLTARQNELENRSSRVPPAEDPQASQRQAELEAQAHGLARDLQALQQLQAEWNTQQAQRQAELDQRAAALDEQQRNLEEARHQLAQNTPPNPEGAHETTIDSTTHRTPQRQRLVRATQRLRARVQKLWNEKGELAKQRDELARHDAYLKVRADNLEQVKKLLERQELIMARKMADHTAIKTVAAVGVFLAMILGITFAGVYWLVAPVYRGEAIVQTTPPAKITDSATPAWLEQQDKSLRNPELIVSAWQTLRQDNYSGHDNREDWINTLDKHLLTRPDPASKSLVIQYTGATADSVAQVANAVALSYVDANKVLQKNDKGQEETLYPARIIAKAVPPAMPISDNRMTLALTLAACLLAVSLMAVLSMRHIVHRQLKDIDHMADSDDLENMAGDIAPE